jgi:MFS family permease
VVLLGLFLRRERRLTRESRDPLVDLRLFRHPSYVSGITLALTFFPAMAGLPLVLALFYQRGLGYTALESALGVTAYAVGSAVSAPLSGRVVTRIGRKLVVAGAITFGAGAIALAVVALHIPVGHATLALALPLFVMGCGQGMLITPNQTLALVDVDPLMGSAAGGVLQTGQRIGLAIGQALIGAVFFNSLTNNSVGSYSRALGHAVIAAICFVSIAVAIGMHDLIRERRRRPQS